MNNDLISREALLKAMEEERQYLLARGQTGAEHIIVHHCLPIIDNAPTIKDRSLEIAQKSIELGRKVGQLEGKLERPQGEWESVGFVSMKYAWCRCSKCHKTTKIYLDSSNEFCCVSDIRKKAVACLYCGADMRGGAE